MRRRGTPRPGAPGAPLPDGGRRPPAAAALRTPGVLRATAAPGRSTGPWVGRSVRGPAGSPGPCSVRPPAQLLSSSSSTRRLAGTTEPFRNGSAPPELGKPAVSPCSGGRRCGRQRAADPAEQAVAGAATPGLGSPRSWGSCLSPAGHQCCQPGTPLSSLCLCPSAALCSGTWGDRADSFQSWQSQR